MSCEAIEKRQKIQNMTLIVISCTYLLISSALMIKIETGKKKELNYTSRS